MLVCILFNNTFLDRNVSISSTVSALSATGMTSCYISELLAAKLDLIPLVLTLCIFWLSFGFQREQIMLHSFRKALFFKAARMEVFVCLQKPLVIQQLKMSSSTL